MQEVLKYFVMSAFCECKSLSLLKMPKKIKAQTMHNGWFDLKCFIYLFAMFPNLFEPDLNLFFILPTSEIKIYKYIYV